MQTTHSRIIIPLALIFLVMLSACELPGIAPNSTPVPWPGDLAPTMTATATATPISFPTITPSIVPVEALITPQIGTATSTTIPTVQISYGSINPLDPALLELEDEGWVRSPMAIWQPYPNNSDPTSRADLENPQWELLLDRFAYIQYITTNEPNTNCSMVFLDTSQPDEQVIEVFDAQQISLRLYKEMNNSDPTLIPEFQCYPLGWGDVNDNGRPDMAVALVWGNDFTAGELHIFELTSKSTVECLTQSLPGVVSPWAFDPSFPQLVVTDLGWTAHDCLENPLQVFSLFEWSNNGYVDVTAEQNYNNFLTSLEEEISSYMGNPFEGETLISPLTLLLVMYDKVGQRALGWNIYMQLVEPSNWPGTTEQNTNWLNSDVDHFNLQQLSDAPFSPNDYCQH